MIKNINTLSKLKYYIRSQFDNDDDEYKNVKAFIYKHFNFDLDDIIFTDKNIFTHIIIIISFGCFGIGVNEKGNNLVLKDYMNTLKDQYNLNNDKRTRDTIGSYINKACKGETDQKTLYEYLIEQKEKSDRYGDLFAEVLGDSNEYTYKNEQLKETMYSVKRIHVKSLYKLYFLKLMSFKMFETRPIPSMSIKEQKEYVYANINNVSNTVENEFTRIYSLLKNADKNSESMSQDDIKELTSTITMNLIHEATRVDDGVKAITDQYDEDDYQDASEEEVINMNQIQEMYIKHYNDLYNIINSDGLNSLINKHIDEDISELLKLVIKYIDKRVRL